MKHKIAFPFLILIFTITLCTITPLHKSYGKEFSEKAPADVLKDPLRSFDERKAALNQLITSPSEELPSLLTNLLQNEKESVVFKRMVSEGIERLNNKDIFQQLESILFNKKSADSFARELSLETLTKVLQQNDKENFYQKLFRLANDSLENPNLRPAAIGYLSNVNFMPEKNKTWAQKIAQTRSEPAQVKTAALNYMEVNQQEELISLLPKVIRNESEDSNFRQIALLKAERNYTDALLPDLKNILESQREPFGVRRVALIILLQHESKETVLAILNPILAKEKTQRMRGELQDAIAKLKSE